jgi:hypothetical protein
LCYLGELNDSEQARWLKVIEVFNEQGELRQLKPVTGDVRDLFRLGKYKGVAIVSPRDFVS